MARRRTRRGGIAQVTRSQVGRRDDVSTRKRSQSTFGLISGDARADLASVAPRDCVVDAERGYRLHLERAAAMSAGLIPSVSYTVPTTNTNR